MGAAVTHDAADFHVAGWQERLQALIQSRMHTPFAWGSHDCCMWAADAVQAQTGIDPASQWRGAYNAASGAVQQLAELGGLAAVGALAGPSILPLQASVGDVGLVHDGERDILAVCAGDVWLLAGNQGLAALPLDAARLAWRVARA